MDEKHDEGWIEWSGGECPVHDAYIEVMLANGMTRCGLSENWQWGADQPMQIVAYRVIWQNVAKNFGGAPNLQGNDDVAAECPGCIAEMLNDTSKPTNPKDAIGTNKLPLHLWPTTASAMGSIGLLNGMLKYGRTNWRHAGVRASIYYDAARRHLDAWFEGEEGDPDDGVPHLAAALACLAIIVDAQAAGKLTDDRAMPAGYRALVTDLTPHVERLKTLHAGKEPKHYTIQDVA